MESLNELPFSSLSNKEINVLLGSIIDQDLINDNIDLFNTLPNPDKSDSCDPDNVLCIPTSNYYSFSKINSGLKQFNHNSSLFALHCNIRSLPKNFGYLHDLLNC